MGRESGRLSRSGGATGGAGETRAGPDSYLLALVRALSWCLAGRRGRSPGPGVSEVPSLRLRVVFQVLDNAEQRQHPSASTWKVVFLCPSLPQRFFPFRGK